MGRRARLGVYFEEKYDWIRGITEDRKEQNERKRKIRKKLRWEDLEEKESVKKIREQENKKGKRKRGNEKNKDKEKHMARQK